MHEFVLTLESLKQEHGVSALDVAKALLDKGMHPPTMYFPLIAHEELMIEPTETENMETLEERHRYFFPYWIPHIKLLKLCTMRRNMQQSGAPTR